MVFRRFRVSQASLGQAKHSFSYGFFIGLGFLKHPLAKQNVAFPIVFHGLGCLKHPLAKQNLPFPIVFGGLGCFKHPLAKQDLAFPIVFHGLGCLKHPLAKQNLSFPMVFHGCGCVKHPLVKQNLAFPMVFYGFMVSQTTLGPAKPKFSNGLSLPSKLGGWLDSLSKSIKKDLGVTRRLKIKF